MPKAPKRLLNVLEVEGAPKEHDFNHAANKKASGRYSAGEVGPKAPVPHAFKGKRIGSIYGKRVGPIE